MTDLITAMSEFFDFIFDQLANFSNFFTNTTLGQIILCSVFIYILVFVVSMFLSLHKK